MKTKSLPPIKFVRDAGLNSLSVNAYHDSSRPRVNGLGVKIYSAYMAKDCTKPNDTQPIVKGVVTDMFMRACGEEVTREFVEQHHPRLIEYLKAKKLID